MAGRNGYVGQHWIRILYYFDQVFSHGVTEGSELNTFKKGHRSQRFWIELFEPFCPKTENFRSGSAGELPKKAI
jgi:hypothetical protein